MASCAPGSMPTRKMPSRAATKSVSTSNIADSTSRSPIFADASAHMIGIPVSAQTR